MIDAHQSYPPGATFVARMHWRIDPERDIRASAGFLVEVRWIDDEDNRFLCLLRRLEYLTTSQPRETVDPQMLARIEALPGRYAFLPFEAAQGRTLFLKTGTLTGRHSYFFDETSDKMPRLSP